MAWNVSNLGIFPIGLKRRSSMVWTLALFLGLRAVVAVAADQGVPKRGKTEMTAKASLSLSLPKQQYVVGEPIPLTISLQNSDDKPISVVVRSALLDHVLSVTDEKGNPVPETAHAMQAKDGAQAGRRAIRKLMPRQALTETIELEKVFELKHPGVYKVSSRRHVSEKDTLEEPFVTVSNQLEIRLVQ